VRKIQQFSVIKLSHDSQNKEIKSEISLPVTYVSLSEENKNNSITSKFAHMLDVFLCVSQNAK